MGVTHVEYIIKKKKRKDQLDELWAHVYNHN